MYKFNTIPRHQPDSQRASHATLKRVTSPFAPRIVWRSAIASSGASFPSLPGARTPLKLLSPVDVARIATRHAYRARSRARLVESLYVAATLATALAIFWSAQ